jgi:type IV secretory pathway VirB2 component (pilin)
MMPFRRGALTTRIIHLPATVTTIGTGSAGAAALPSDSECSSQIIGNIGCIPYFLRNIVSAGLLLAALVAVVLIIISGIRLLTSGGDPLKVASAKRSLTFTIIGLVIVLLAFVIINLIARVTGAKI